MSVRAGGLLPLSRVHEAVVLVVVGVVVLCYFPLWSYTQQAPYESPVFGFKSVKKEGKVSSNKRVNFPFWYLKSSCIASLPFVYLP